MKEFVIAKNAGFCFGVKRAVDEAYRLISIDNKPIYSIGPLIHNEVVTDDLKSKGLIILDNYDNIVSLKDSKVIIRTHGIEKNVFDILKSNNNEVYDLTCPFVKKIHNIVKEKSENGYKIILIGDKNHPEVKGIKSYANGDIYVVLTENDVKSLKIDKNSKVFVVFQTTTNVENSQKLVDILRDLFYNITVVNTICNTTNDRQMEVFDLSKKCDAMLIIGSETSSNTKKLFDIAKQNCKDTYMLANKNDLLNIHIKDNAKVGVSAGASTPEYLIEEILKNARDEF